ncbi:MAG: tyrosine-protein kinase ptk [Bacteroidetes bacterium]|jgi:tyrosine-protein kinase Etk/Wzc|nr:tyrosine-protein kinase ptk [Bacteroidota bacterium]
MSNNSYSPSLAQPKEEKSINLLDILKYLLFYWKWYIVSIALFVGYFYYQYSKTPLVYRQTMTVMIKTPNNSQGTMRMNRFNSFISPVNVANEILQFRSKEIMRRVIDRSLANISYTIHRGLRDTELYTESPIQVNFINNNPEAYSSFLVQIQDNHLVKLTVHPETDSESSISVPLGKEVNTSIGRILITSNDTYSQDWYGKTIKVTKYPRENMVGQFTSSLSITQTDEAAAIMQLQLNDNSPLRAAKILNTLVEVYNQEAIIDKNRIGVNTDKFIKERIGLIENELGSVESDLEKLKTGYGGVDVNSAGEMFVSDSRQYKSQEKELSTQIRLVNFMKHYLNDANEINSLIPNNTGLVDASLEDQINKYNSALLKRDRLLENSGANNPIVQEMNKSLHALKQNIITAANNTITGLSIKKKDASQEASKAQGQAMQIPAKQREILSVERQQKVKEELYIFLLNKREENALNQAMVDDNARIIDPATGSFSPIYPKKFKKLLLGGACGLAIPSIILILMLMLDTKVRTRKEIEEVVNVPFLAEIPFSKNINVDNLGIFVKQQGNDSLSESFRILRTNLGFMDAGGDPKKVITFTSFSAGAGKTFTSLNMAASLTLIKKKVVLLDLDLRKGTLSMRLKAKNDKGATHYLSDHSLSMDDVIIKNIPLPGIDLIPIGVIAPNPVELLLSKRLDQLIEELKKLYDYIIVDNVPLGVVADSSIINRITDVTIFVVRSGKLDRRQLPEIERIYQERRLSNMAILFNGVQKTAFNYGYGYGYGEYGYDNHKKSKWKFWKK